MNRSMMAAKAAPAAAAAVSSARDRLTASFRAERAVTSLSLAPDGAYIAAGFANGVVMLYPVILCTSSQTAAGKGDEEEGWELGHLEGKGLNTSLKTHVAITDDRRFLFAGVLRGTTEMLAVDLSALPTWGSADVTLTGRTSKEKSLLHERLQKRLVVHRYSDAKLRGFGAAARVAPSSNLAEYRLFCGLGIKNIHIWSFQVGSNPGETPSWTCIFDFQTNGMSLETVSFRKNGLEGVSKSNHQCVRIWDLSKANETNDRPPFRDVANTQDAKGVFGDFAYGGDYNLSMVNMDAAEWANRTELAISDTNAQGGGGVSSRKRHCRTVKQVMGTEDGGHLLVRCSDDQVLYYNRTRSSDMTLQDLDLSAAGDAPIEYIKVAATNQSRVPAVITSRSCGLVDVRLVPCDISEQQSCTPPQTPPTLHILSPTSASRFSEQYARKKIASSAPAVRDPAIKVRPPPLSLPPSAKNAPAAAVAAPLPQKSLSGAQLQQTPGSVSIKKRKKAQSADIGGTSSSSSNSVQPSARLSLPTGFSPSVVGMTTPTNKEAKVRRELAPPPSADSLCTDIGALSEVEKSVVRSSSRKRLKKTASAIKAAKGDVAVEFNYESCTESVATTAPTHSDVDSETMSVAGTPKKPAKKHSQSAIVERPTHKKKEAVASGESSAPFRTGSRILLPRAGISSTEARAGNFPVPTPSPPSPLPSLRVVRLSESDGSCEPHALPDCVIAVLASEKASAAKIGGPITGLHPAAVSLAVPHASSSFAMIRPPPSSRSMTDASELQRKALEARFSSEHTILSRCYAQAQSRSRMRGAAIDAIDHESQSQGGGIDLLNGRIRHSGTLLWDQRVRTGASASGESLLLERLVKEEAEQFWELCTEVLGRQRLEARVLRDLQSAELPHGQSAPLVHVPVSLHEIIKF